MSGPTKPTNTVAIACDHGGVAMKAALIDVIRAQGLEVLDLGTNTSESVDYPDFADALADALVDGRADRGVLICGTGIGISIAANRHMHIRAALCHSTTDARLARQHNDANVIAFGARTMGAEIAVDALQTFLTTGFDGGRHERRVAKMSRPK